MGVKVKLADTREVGDRQYKAGDVVDVHPSDARLLVALGAGAVVDEADTPAAGDPVPEAVPGNETKTKDEPAAGDVPASGVNTAPATIKPGPAGRKG